MSSLPDNKDWLLKVRPVKTSLLPNKSESLPEFSCFKHPCCRTTRIGSSMCGWSECTHCTSQRPWCWSTLTGPLGVAVAKVVAVQLNVLAAGQRRLAPLCSFCKCPGHRTPWTSSAGCGRSECTSCTSQRLSCRITRTGCRWCACSKYRGGQGQHHCSRPPRTGSSGCLCPNRSYCNVKAHAA